MEELRKNNTSPIFQQYITLSEENARLSKELNMLRYKVTDTQEERDSLQRACNEETKAKKAATELATRARKEKEFFCLVRFPVFHPSRR